MINFVDSVFGIIYGTDLFQLHSFVVLTFITKRKELHINGAIIIMSSKIAGEFFLAANDLAQRDGHFCEPTWHNFEKVCRKLKEKIQSFYD